MSYAYNSYWSIPLHENGEVKIFNRAGSTVAEFDLSTEEDTVWDGLTSEGEKLNTGLYSFMIITKSKKTYTGSISVLE